MPRWCATRFAALADEVAAATGARAHAGGDRRRASCASPSTTWPTRSSRSRSQRGYDVTELHAVLLRRRRRPACLRGGRRAGHDHHLHPPAGRRAVGLRHGAGRLRVLREQAVEARARRRPSVSRALAAGSRRWPPTRAPRSAARASPRERDRRSQRTVHLKIRRHRHRRCRSSPWQRRARRSQPASRRRYRQRYGFIDAGQARASSRRSRWRRSARRREPTRAIPPAGRADAAPRRAVAARPIYSGRRRACAPVLRSRRRCGPATRIAGPAIIVEPNAHHGGRARLAARGDGARMTGADARRRRCAAARGRHRRSIR